MKKLVLLILSFALSSQVFAQEVSPKYLAEALEMEKNFLLAVTTSLDGERLIGTTHYVRMSASTPTFYIKKARSCKNNPTVCTDEVVAKALASAQRFAADYNALVGKEVVTISDESSWGSIPISLVSDISGGFLGKWYCRNDSGGRLGQCSIRARFDRYDIGRIVAHEMLNVLSIQDTRKLVFRNCLSFDGNNSTEFLDDYYGLCESEKKAIVFAFNHLRPGMRKGSIGKAFDKHWKPSEFTYALAAQLKEIDDARYSFCKRTKGPSCLKEFPSLKDS
ncbi:MAG: hypothetical protein ACR2PV_03440 [Gammaproteobacteria bacterium]